jgi:zinc protease
MVALVRENFSSPSVVVRGYLPVGSVLEGDDTAGLAAFTASLLSRGTERRSFDQINEAVEGLGATVAFSAGRHVTSFRSRSLANDLETILEVLVDQLRRPTFPSEHVEKVRGQWLTDLQERDHDTRRMAGLTFRELAFPGHAYGRSAIGYHETASRIRRGDVTEFYQSHYGPRGGAVAVVGAVGSDTAIAHVENVFDGWLVKNGDVDDRALPLPPTVDTVRRKSVVMPGKTQSDIVLGCSGLARSDADYYAALVANTVLGRFGMYGRLGENVRERQGLAYYSLSSLEAGVWPGPWYVFAGVNPANVERAVESILHEIARMGQELVPSEELQDSQAFLTGSLPLRLESNEGMAGALLEIERYGLGLDYLHRYGSLIQDVTAVEVQAVAAKYLSPNAYALAVAGPPVPDAA